ncbi:hypothetical protein [Parerythrobacter jejuensis]|uniref:hypothetical protein n=1 Tax=Parerythrobacter jejuensis TaxID=795812 RepID=UPI001F4422A9|nr:hypothetical protein [Parerythrobacter jejuensis]
MKTALRFGLVAAGALTLAACGDTEDASEEAMADNVEIPADEAMTEVADEPVADDAATADTAEEASTEATAEEQATAEAAGEAAADAAADVQAAVDAAAATAGDITDAANDAADAAEAVVDQ